MYRALKKLLLGVDDSGLLLAKEFAKALLDTLIEYISLALATPRASLLAHRLNIGVADKCRHRCALGGGDVQQIPRSG